MCVCVFAGVGGTRTKLTTKGDYILPSIIHYHCNKPEDKELLINVPNRPRVSGVH